MMRLSRVILAAVSVAMFGWTEEFPELFPFVISYDAPENAVNMTHLLAAPAGKDGFVRVEGGHFVTDAGRIRFNATNLTGPANFPTHEQADKLAARLARFGINCVRLHYFDAEYGNFMTESERGIYGKGGALARAFNANPTKEFPFEAEAVDRQDYLLAALKKRGIYVNMNLHVARFPKGVSFFSPRVIAAEKVYAKRLLERVNPYTGMRVADDPGIAMIEINNENGIFNNYFRGRLDTLSAAYKEEFQACWNSWLRKKYTTTEAMLKAYKWESQPLGAEMIEDGGFGEPIVFDGRRWIIDKGGAGVAAVARQGSLVVTVERDGSEFFPKLYRRTVVKRDAPYTLSFKIRRSQGAGETTLGLAVADRTTGWRSLGLLQQIKVGREWQSHNIAFVATDSCEAAEIQLTRFKTGEYEIDDLSLRSGAVTEFDSKARIEEGTLPIIKSFGFAPPAARQDFVRFLWDTERSYWQAIAKWVKEEIGARAPISGTQLGYSPAQLQAELDYVDNHAYWHHPAVNKNWWIVDASMVNSLQCIRALAEKRVVGKPYTISEYNHPFPNHYGAEGQPMLRAYAALQGWDGVFEYTYNHSLDFEPPCNTYFFSMIARTDVLAHLPACATMFLRGDVREALGSVVGHQTYDEWFERCERQRNYATSIGGLGIDNTYTLVHKAGVEFCAVGESPPLQPANPQWGKVIRSDTGELIWNRERAGKGYWCVDTPNTKLFSGFADGREVELGGVRIVPGRSRLGWATISLLSKNGTGFGGGKQAATILLTATGVAQNESAEVVKVDDTKIAFKERLQWGVGKVLMEGVPATVTLPAAAQRVRCYALDERGERKGSVPVMATDGGSTITIGAQYRTIWYEIEVAG